jgi:superfamily II DNA or RNA helicase
MDQAQIDYYNSLSGTKKEVVRVAALKAVAVNEHTMFRLFMFNGFTRRKIRDTLSEAARHKLFVQNDKYSMDYYANPDFMLYVFPELSDLRLVWASVLKESNGFFYSSFTQPIGQFRNCLYALCHVPKDYYKFEVQYLRDLSADKIHLYCKLIELEAYESKIHLISPILLNEALKPLINDKTNRLEPLPEISRLFNRLMQAYGRSDAVDALYLQKESLMLSGCFKEALAMLHESQQQTVLEALMRLTEGHVKESYASFEKVIKLHRQTFREALTPATPAMSLYYFVALMCIDPQLSTPQFRKMEQWLKSNAHVGDLSLFAAIVYHVLNIKDLEAGALALLRGHILDTAEEKGYTGLIALPVYYLTGRKMTADMADATYALVEKAWKGGYVILAYEAAYAMQSWFDQARCAKLYQMIASTLSYPPVLSHIRHQEDWEKSLNLLLGLKMTPNKTAKEGESKTRVVYYFNPKYDDLQPVLQTRQTKGWSAGRNIAMKTFFECKTQGMTPQDIRIAKTVKHYKDYYNDSYEFTDEVYPQLPGHPHIFLANSKDIPVEFIAAQPIVKVAKSKNGYALSTNLTDTSKKIFVQKETNTRYLVFSLTPMQMQILQIIAEQSIEVPEQGKNKLIELLAAFSAQDMNVHSDLLASGSAELQVKEVPADSRIRIQLLPLGDGLRAELFSKPFGEHPPYCKPGKGGKVLIANEKEGQLQVRRDLEKESANESILLNDIQSLESLDIADGLITFSDPLDSLSMLDLLAHHQDVSVVEWPEGERFRIRGAAGFGNLSVRLKSGVDWFDLQGELKVDENTVISLQQLLVLTAKSRNRFVELSPGEFVALSNDLKKQLDELSLFSTAGKNDVKLNKFASVALDDFFDQVEQLKTDKLWKDFRKRVDSIKVSNIPVPACLEAELRTYQEEGFQWLARLAEWGSGACLADDMGLGKTVQTLAVLLHRAAQGPAMVVCPASVVGNWVNETRRFAPTLQVKTFAGAGNRKEQMELLEAGDLLVISYGLLQTEAELLSEQSFATIVLDEAHAIKNYATKTSRATMQLKAAFRVALTGTPIQNHLGEIWNIFNFINPGLLGSVQHFTDTFIKADNEKTRKHLRKLIAPFILRRTKTAVLDELPPKTEIVKKVELSVEERAFYEAVRRQAIENLSGSDATNGAKHIQALAEITRLRQASCHPQLIDPAIHIESSKLSMFLEIVNELRENKHRALVFSQFVTHLSIVRKSLDKLGVRYQYLDGSTSMAERERNVRTFQNGEGELFLISLKAGGLGLNLTAADFVIHLDPWWNPAIEDQASDRAHRIGQTRPVTIYRLVAENTIEEKIIQLHTTKRDLAESLLEGSDRSARLSLTELIALIKEREI